MLIFDIKNEEAFEPELHRLNDDDTVAVTIQFKFKISEVGRRDSDLKAWWQRFERIDQHSDAVFQPFERNAKGWLTCNEAVRATPNELMDQLEHKMTVLVNALSDKL